MHYALIDLRRSRLIIVSISPLQRISFYLSGQHPLLFRVRHSLSEIGAKMWLKRAEPVRKERGFAQAKTAESP